jgi:1-acyl-sn-glycerol-3-phosphate acyltransferase
MIASKTGAPIVPVGIIGTNMIGKGLPRLIVRFGNPIQTIQGKADKKALEQLGNEVMQQIGKLL